MGHFFPLVARIYGGDLSAEDSIPYYELYDYSVNRSRQVMSAKANDFAKQAIESGLLFEGPGSLQEKLIQKYEDYGFDRILVGMKRKIYVDQLKIFLD